LKAHEKLFKPTAEGKILTSFAMGNTIYPRHYANIYYKEHAHQISIGEIDVERLIAEIDLTKYTVISVALDTAHESVIEERNETVYKDRKREVVQVESLVLVHKEYNILLVLEDPFAALFCLQAGLKLTFELGQEIIEKYGRRHGEDEFGDIGILTKRDNKDYEIQALEISNPEMTVEESYPPEISKEHEQVVEILSREKDAKGILLMHGKPGTGKTTYIRHLIKEVDKKFIFVPPDVAAEFGSPEITKVLLDFSNCILIIEDGEKVLKARAKGITSPISALLNLSDGLLSDALHIQVIATFNCDVDEIDPAIMRKGRLLKRLVFPEMGIEQANKIRAKLKKAPLAGGKAATFTVAEIYND
jgi:hypothetical protein